ncbi:hypothetical protein TSTA_116600 [Talaromyces stipitatus ATCC 10500]|uniref:Uncharacterized protein n=1 Tax=Talaromyces stipitatus (strain ATCC 10500 / CBS 375.48 / QM 6759 / NRRL 1006) TaxID=441959 RepID=B8MBK7_TALSN|nr:uncharacterized protein TSTA_116600 [Talaromyces stipitatus ATCC 10500]EED17871.1 hypothetical protein TSTA_116600 [Talaromyces stipitatus ATCC 10500]
MSFLQSLFRRFSRKQEETPPESHQHESFEDDAKLDDDTNWEEDTNQDDSTNLENGTNWDDDANIDAGTDLEDDANLTGEQETKNDSDTQTDLKWKGDTHPNTTTGSSGDDNKWTPRKSDAEPQYAYSRDRPYTPRFVNQGNSHLPPAVNATTLAASTPQYLTHAPPSSSFSTRFVNESPTTVVSEPRTGPRIKFFKPARKRTSKRLKDQSLTVLERKTSPSSQENYSITPQNAPEVAPRTASQNVTPNAPQNETNTNLKTEPSTSTNDKPIKPQDESTFDQADIADQPRLPWNWTAFGTKTKEVYEPTAVGKWWYMWAQENRDSPRVASNIGRIMETELGVQRIGADRCTRCQIQGLECWVYSVKARFQVNNPGSACARCRADPACMGCSLSQRSKKRKGSPLPPPPPRLLLPKGGHPAYSTQYMSPETSTIGAYQPAYIAPSSRMPYS